MIVFYFGEILYCLGFFISRAMPCTLLPIACQKELAASAKRPRTPLIRISLRRLRRGVGSGPGHNRIEISKPKINDNDHTRHRCAKKTLRFTGSLKDLQLFYETFLIRIHFTSFNTTGRPFSAAISFCRKTNFSTASVFLPSALKKSSLFFVKLGITTRASSCFAISPQPPAPKNDPRQPAE